MFTIDFETYYDKDYSLRKLTTEQYIRDPRFEVIGVAIKKNNEPTVFHLADKGDWKGSIQKVLNKYNLHNEAVLAHNAVFDMAILNWHFGIKPKVILDTLSMARPITMLTVGGSLKALAEMYGIGHKGTAVHDMLGIHLADMTDQQCYDYGEYCKLDVDLTYQLFHKLKGSSTPMEMRIIDIMLRMFTEPMCHLDRGMLESHLNAVRERNRKLLHDTGMDDREVLMSNVKFAEALRSVGVEPPMKESPTTGKQTYAFSKKDTDFLDLLEHPDERVRSLVAARLGLKSTLEETRTEHLIGVADRGNMPCMLLYYGAHTGRASGADKINLQNLPRGGVIRHSIKPPEGYKLVACDSSNIEARMLAWFAGQSDLVQEFAEGVDVYSSFASKIFGRPINKHDNPAERFIGKTCVLGLGYGAGGLVLNRALATAGKNAVKQEVEESKRIVNVYRTTYRQIAELWRSADSFINLMAQGFKAQLGVGIQLQSEGNKVRLPNGMHVNYNDLHCETNPFTGKPGLVYMNKRKPVSVYGAKVVENIIQALARIVVFEQMVDIDYWLRVKTAKDGIPRRVCLMVHDEIVVCVPENEANEAYDYMLKAMSKPPVWAPDLPIAAEGATGKSYGECK